MKFKSLKTRVLLWFGGVVAILLILFSISFRYFLNQSINNNIKIKLHHDASDILSSFIENKAILNNQKIYKTAILIIKNKKLLYTSKNFSLHKIKKFIKSNQTFQIQETQNDETVNAIYILKKGEYTLIAYKKNIDNKIENFEDTLLILDPILLLLLIYIASKLIDKILLPIKKITKTAQDISVNNFSNIIEVPKDNDEIKGLINSFNEMIIRLKNGVENLEQFNNDVSHELKTPLTVIKGEIEVTLRKLRTSNEYQTSMNTIYYEVQQMQIIVENLLLLTKYSKQNIKQSFEICNLDSILLEIIEKYSPTLQEKNIHLIIKRIEPLEIEANKVLISSIFSNLIENAIKYSKNNKHIYISLYQDKKVYFKIQDEGIGIEKKELEKITQRFYRIDSSRNKNIKGFGLGLSIVKNSVDLHNAKMKISSTLKVGTNISIEF